MTMNRRDDFDSDARIRAFVECSAEHATHRIGPSGIDLAAAGTPCYTREGANLSLCASCTEFWLECDEHNDATTWQLAVYLRDLRGFDFADPT